MKRLALCALCVLLAATAAVAAPAPFPKADRKPAPQERGSLPARPAPVFLEEDALPLRVWGRQPAPLAPLRLMPARRAAPPMPGR
jgi:hypothetical protein